MYFLCSNNSWGPASLQSVIDLFILFRYYYTDCAMLGVTNKKYISFFLQVTYILIVTIIHISHNIFLDILI